MTPAPPASLVRRLLAALLLLAGVAAVYGWFGRLGWALISIGQAGPAGAARMAAFVAVVVGMATYRSTAAVLTAALARWEAVVARHRWAFAVAAAVATVAFLYATAVGQGRHFGPYIHDESSYLIQAHQLAHGRGWMPQHPLAPFFDSFQLFTSPVYASAYFPGTALVHVPGVWLHLPPWATSLAVAGAVAGLLFQIVAEVLDAAAAVVAIVMLWGSTIYLSMSTATMAQLPLLMFGLAATVGWLRWRAAPGPRSAAVIGACLGLAAITRPLDALCFAVPIGVAMLPAFRTPRRAAASAAALVAAALPALLLQLALNHGITGRWTESPFRLYADRDYPGTAYGFRPFAPDARPQSPLPQKQMLYETYRPLLRDHTPALAVDSLVRAHGFGGLAPARLPLVFTLLLPTQALLALVPLAVLGLTRRRAVVLAALPLFLGLYFGYVFFFPHYTLTTAAAVIVATLAGAAQLPSLLSRPAVGRIAVPLVLGGMALAALPQVQPMGTGDLFDTRLLADVDQQLATLGHARAAVLFAFSPERDLNAEPVYNAGVAWPDDAAVVRAHDLGPARDAELFAYYARRQPDRFAYRYDEATRTLTPLGPVTALADGAHPAPPRSSVGQRGG